MKPMIVIPILQWTMGCLFLIGTGCIFGLIANITAIKKQAIQSRQWRMFIIFGISVITFSVLMIVGAYLETIITTDFLRYSMVGFYSGENPYEIGTQQNALLTQELWLQNILPPVLLSVDTCFTGNKEICDTVYGLSNLFEINYSYNLAISIIPAISCVFTVRFITQDNRKRKIAET